MKIYDKFIIVIMIILVVISTGLALKPNNDTVDSVTMRISINGDIYKEVPIDNRTDEYFNIESEYGYNIIRVVDGKVSIHDADCPGKYCVDKGEISGTKEIIVCLPHRLVVELVGKTTDDVDFISQ